MALDYRQVKDLYDTLHGAGVVSDTLPNWSNEMNRLTDSDLYSAGLQDNFVKRSSVAIDRLLESTGFPKVTGAFGRATGELVGAPDAGERIGEGLPRMAVNFAPLAVPGPGWVTAAGLGLTGLLSGAQTYTETGSPAAGVLSGATAVAAPGIAGAAERGTLAALGARRVTGPLLDAAGNVTRADQFFPTGIQNFLSKGAGQAAAAGTFAASGAGQEALAGEPVSSPLTVDNLLNLTLGQLPFALAHLGGRAIRGKGPEGPSADELQHAVDISKDLIDKQNAKAKLLKENPVESLPDVNQETTPEVMQQTNELLSKLRGEQAKISNDPNLTPEQKVVGIDALVKQESDVLRDRAATTGDTVFGDSIQPDAERQQVIGTEVIRTKNKKYRAILVSDDPSNPEELRGKVIGYSTAYETPPTEAQQKGQKVYNLPGAQWQTVKTKEEWNSRFAKVADKNQPELPPQDRPATDEERNAHIADLNKVKVEADAAQTPADLQKATVRLRGVQEENNLPVTNDKKLSKRAKLLAKLLDDPAEVTKAAVKAEATKTQREIERAAEQLSPAHAAAVSALMEGDQSGNAGYSVITADKLSHKEPETFEDIPVNNIVTETAAQTVQGQAGRDAFEAWDRKSETTLGQEAVMFHMLVDEFGSLKDVDVNDAGEYLHSIRDIPVADAKDEIADFLQRPHVKVWEKELDARLSAMRSVNAAPPVAIPAGRSWLLSIGNYDPVTNVLNGKHKLPKSGDINAAAFRNMAGVGKPLSEAEMGLYRQIVPEAFRGSDVNVPKLVEGLRNKGPIVETKTLGVGEISKVASRARDYQHELETAGYHIEDDDYAIMLASATDEDVQNEHLPPRLQTAITYIRDHAEQLRDEWYHGDHNTYRSIAPKPEKEMPGFVAGLVRLPTTDITPFPDITKRKFPLAETIKYRGPHFGAEDTNVLAFYRGYIETLPDGTKAFHVIEVQSDWAQRLHGRLEVRKEAIAKSTKEQQEFLDKVSQFRVIKTGEGDGTLLWFNDKNELVHGATTDTFDITNKLAQELPEGFHKLTPELRARFEKEGAEFIVARRNQIEKNLGPPEHPLLKVYESLALKAAIQHAKEVGASKVIVSDAETAMMTEGHDRVQQGIGPIANENHVQLTTLNEVNRVNDFLRERYAAGDKRFQNLTTSREDYTVYAENATRPEAIQQLKALSEELGFPFVAGKQPIPQEGGMRQHYDQSIPSAMQKLTRDKGEAVDLGPHKMTVPVWDRYEGDQTTPNGSPVFKDALGQPKTQITGRAYDISKTPDAFTLTDPRMAPQRIERFEPQTESDQTVVKRLGNDGHSAVRFLSESKNPVIQALAKDLEKFSDSLGRVTLSVGRTQSGASLAQFDGMSRVNILISHGVLNNPERLDFSVAHELVHALTLNELHNPVNAKIVNQLDDLRLRVRDYLPVKLRDVVQKAVDTDWYGRYTQAKTDIRELFPNGVTQLELDTVYALLNTDEFVAQGLSSQPFQDFLRVIKDEKKATWFSRFTNTIKTLLGIKSSAISESAFGEFLSKTDQLLEHGNFQSSFSDFADRYFENRGMSKGDVFMNTRKALEVVLKADKDTTPSSIISQLSFSGQAHSQEFTDAWHHADMMLKFGDNPESEQGKKVLGEMGFEPGNVGGLDSYTNQLLHGVLPNDADAIDLLPKFAQDYIFAKASSVYDVLGVLDAATTERNRGLLNIADPMVLIGPVTRAARLVNEVMLMKKEWQRSEQLVHQMGSIAPDAFIVSDRPDPEQAPVAEAFMRDSTARKERGLGWFLNPVAQIARVIPQAREIIDAAFRLEASARQYFGQTLKPMGIDFREGTNLLAGDVVKANIKLLRNPRTFDAINNWMAENNKRANDEDRGVTLLPESDAEVMKHLAGLSQQEKVDVSEFVKNQGVMTQVEHLQALNYALKIGSARAGIIVMKDQPTYKSFQAAELTDYMFKALLVDRTDPVASQQADAQLKIVQSKMTPEGFLDFLKYSQAEIENYNNWKTYYEQNPYWNTAQRQEKYLVKFKNKDGYQNLQASSTKEANEIFKKYRGIGVPEITENFKGRNDEFPSLGPDIAKMSSRMKELQDTQVAIMKDRVSPEALDAMIKYSPTTQILREAAGEGGGIPRFATPPRLLSQGAEKLPWFWNHISYMQRRSNYWTRQLLRAKTDLLLNDPDMLSDPNLASQMKQHVENMLQPDPQLVQKLNRFTSTWFMGFAPASAMVNGMQTLSTLVPELTNITGRAVHSYGLWKQAVSDTVGHYVKGGGKVWKEKEIDDLMRFTEHAGGIGFSMWDEEAQTHEQISMGFKQAMMKDKPQNLGQRLSTMAGVWSTAGMWMFKNVEMFNQRVATIAAYRAYRELGSSVEEAQQQALETNRAVNYGGGRAGRPIGLYAGSDQFTRGAAMLATNMQNYNLGVVSQLGRYLQSGFFRPGELKPSEVFAARKAGIQMLTMQLGAAGLLGLPFVSGAVALLNQMFPNLELNKKLRESVADFFSSDKANGSILGDAAMTGLPSMLGWDMQSRLSMGNVTPGVSEYNGFQPGLLLGPPANLVTSFVNGTLKVVQGEPQGAAAFIPPGLKKLTQYVTGDGTLKDYKNRPLFNPTLGETAGLALGFNPKRLSDLNAASRMADQTTQMANRREGQFRSEQAADVLKGNFGSVRQALLARAQEDKSYNLSEAVRAVAQASEDQFFPRDLRRESTRSTDASRNRLLSTFNLSPQVSSEVERLKFRQQVEQRLGLRTQDSGQLATASVMDRLRQQNPGASRVELRRQAESMLHGARRTPSLLQETP